jgi:hypothetical protein
MSQAASSPFERAPLVVTLACFAVYCALALPSLYWLDSSEFAAAAWTLGVAHPPGQPLTALCGRLATLLPLGAVGFRVALSQAVAGALAVWAVTRIAARVLTQVGSDGVERALLQSFAGALFGLSVGHAFQSVRPEVYALSAALTLGASACALSHDADGGARSAMACALLLGLGLTNHHLLTIVGALPVLALFLSRRRLAPGAWAVILAAGTLGLGIYLYLPLRAARAPLVNWGDPQTATRFLWVVSARAFQRAVTKAVVAPIQFETMRELSPIAAVLAFVGFALLLARARTRRVGAFLFAEFALHAAVLMLLGGFELRNPDRRGYFAPAVAYAAVAAAALLATLLRGAKALRKSLVSSGAAVAAAGALAWQIANVHEVSLARLESAERILMAGLDEAPPRAVITTEYYQTIFGLWYLRAVEGARPDCDVVDEHLATFPGYAPVRVAPAAGRPALYEFDLDTPAARLRTLAPLTFFYRQGTPATRADYAAQDAHWDRMLAYIAPDLEDLETRNFVLWFFFRAALARCGGGHPVAGQAAIARAVALNGGWAPELSQLAENCR